MEPETDWQVNSLLTWGTEWLEGKGIAQPRLHMEHFLSHVLKRKRLELYLEFDRPVMAGELKQLKEFLKRHVQGEPLAYITGQTEFYNCPLWVDKRVLIPRPETESMVDTIMHWVAMETPENVVDLGTGSGCIAIALARSLTYTVIDALDYSREAVTLATENASRNEVADRIRFHIADMLHFLDEQDSWDLIVSNPPYISRKDYEQLEISVKSFEPSMALTDEGDGTHYLAGLIERLPHCLTDQGRAFIEFGYDQGAWVQKKIVDVGGLKGVIHKDIHECDRFVEVHKKV